jgi:ankyrin repeat protein
VDKGADFNLADNSGRTALKKAAENGRTDTVKLLKQFGALEL